MAVRKLKPVTPGQRHKVIGTFEDITASVPEKSLFVLSGTNNNVYLSARNLQGTEVMEASKLNTYKVLNADVVIITEKSLQTIDGILNK